MTPNVWIVLVNYNGLADTKACLRSLAGQTRPASVVVVDNASAVDPVGELRAEFPGVDVVQAGTNGGWAGGNNVGLRHALDRGADWVVLLNNDTTVSPDLVARLVAAAAARPDVGVLGPVIRFMAPPSEVQTEGVVFNRPDRTGFFQRHPVPLRADDPPHIVDVDIVNGCCLMVRRAVVDKIGFVDEAFFLIHEESDFCLRAQEAGFANGVLAEALVWHKGSSSFQREGKRLQRYFDTRNIPRLLRPPPPPARRAVARPWAVPLSEVRLPPVRGRAGGGLRRPGPGGGRRAVRRPDRELRPVPEVESMGRRTVGPAVRRRLAAERRAGRR